MAEVESNASLSAAVVPLLKGVLYREEQPRLWNDLLGLQGAVRDYLAVLGLELALDEAEGYAFLRSRADADGGDDEPTIPRLIARRPLSFPVSLLLALLRKRLAEFDAMGGDTRLVLSREQIVETMRLFSPDASNEAKLADRIDGQIKRVCEMGFLRRLKPERGASGESFEVCRILKAFVDAQWLSEFDARLEEYRLALAGEDKAQGEADDD